MADVVLAGIRRIWSRSDRSMDPRDMQGVCTTAPTTDAQLVALLRTGDLRALGTLYTRYGADVRRLALRLDPTADPATADDICQTVFLTFLDTLERYEHRDTLRGWLLGITARHCRSTTRRWWRRLRIRTHAGWSAAGVAPGPAAADTRLEAREAVARALAVLPAAQREVLVLHHLEGLSIPAVARILHISENAVSTRLYRARRAMEATR